MASVSVVDAFNSTFKNFLEELVNVFPDEPGIASVSLFLAGFDSYVSSEPRAAMDAFLKELAPHADAITAKDGKMFKKLSLPGGVTLKDVWKKADAETKEAVWQYLQMLFLLATTAASMPPEVLSSIESLAGEYGEKVKNGELNIEEVTGKLLGGDLFGNLDFGAMLGAPEPPRPKKK